jgi:N-acetylmuramoyl-L-alanine amidase
VRKSTEYIVIHCSATPASHDVDAKEIDRWHRAKGWLKIGYHFVIKRDGTVQKGRDLDAVGAHVAGFNHCSVGVCVVGGMDKDNKHPEDNFTLAQRQALHCLLTDLEALYPSAALVGHWELDPKKACPVLDMRVLRAERDHTRVAKMAVREQLD